MTYHGYIKNGTVVVEEPLALPDGTPVEISVVALSQPPQTMKPVWQLAVEAGEFVPTEEWEKMPADASKQLDHYLYGTAKRDE